MDLDGDPDGGDHGGMMETNLYQDSKESRDMIDGLWGSQKGSSRAEISGKKEATLTDFKNESTVKPAFFRFDKEKKELVRVGEDENVADEKIKAGNEGGDKSGAYSKHLEEYKKIYKDMALWETIVKKREEENARGGLKNDGVTSDAFLETAKQNFQKFKKLERNHIMSGVIDERNIWEDSDDEEDEGDDDDGLEIVQEGEEQEESEDEKMAEIKYFTKTEYVYDKKRANFEQGIDIDAFSETAGDELMKDNSAGNQGEKRKSMEDHSQDPSEGEEKEGWTKVVNKKNPSSRQRGNSGVKFNAESRDKDALRDTNTMQRTKDNKAEKITSARKEDIKSANRTNIIENPYGRRQEMAKRVTKTQELKGSNEKQVLGNQSVEGGFGTTQVWWCRLPHKLPHTRK